MKRLWLFLLSLALVIVFSASAFAVDVKFSGEYYAAGMYLDKVGLNKSGYETFAQLTWLFIFLINVTSNIL